MPQITVRFATPSIAGAAVHQAIAALASRLAASILHKDERLTAVIVDEVDPAHWFIAGQPVSKLGVAAYSLTITVTDSTNTKAEKAAFLAAVHEGMRSLLGPVHDDCYTHVIDARADAYGYGGLSQEHRHVVAVLGAADNRDRALSAIARYGVR